jgi:MFS family permease
MKDSGFKVYGYRWVVLIAFMLLNIVIQIQWLTHAPVARAAEEFYRGQFNPDSLINIDFLAMSYMLVYLAMCLPASYVITRYGIKVGVGIGALLAAVFGLTKGIFASAFVPVVISQIGLAVAQPFILNAVTAVSVRWFPLRERGLAAGMSALAQYLGIILAMGITPLMVVTSPKDPAYGQGIPGMLLVYGIITCAAGLVSFFLIKEKPPTPPSKEEYKPSRFGEGFKIIFGRKDMVLMILLFFIGLGIFNAVSSMIDSISGNLGVEDSNGLLGVLMLLGGVIGAVLLPALSDKLRKRKAFLVLCIAGMVPGVAGLAFADLLPFSQSGVYIVALASSFVLGFFVMSAGPIGFQYAAEVSAPAPESSSQGLLLLAGQITGLIFVAGMSIKSNQYLNLFMGIFALLAAVAFVGVLLLKESPMIVTEKEKYGG